MARVIVTGGTGFVGSHLVEALLDAGDEVSCLVRSIAQPRWLATSPVQLCEGDLGEPSSYRSLLKEADLVYHVAALTKSLDDDAYERINVQGTARLLEACAESGRRLRRVVIVSSLAAVGPSLDGRAVDETAPCRPVTPYGRSKHKAELIAAEFGTRLPITIVRPPVVYGPRDVDGLVLYRQARRGFLPIAAAASRISLVHVKDLVAGIILAGQADVAVGQTYFLSDPTPLEYREFAKSIGMAVGRSIMLVPVPAAVVRLAGTGSGWIARRRAKTTIFDRHKAEEMLAGNWVCTPTKAMAELGFHPRFEPARAFADTAAWYRAAGWL